MGSFRDTRNVLLESYSENIIDDTEFSLLYDLNTSHNPDFPYWNYGQFDLESISAAECKAEFRFYKNDIYMLADRLGLPEKLCTELLCKAQTIKCVMLKCKHCGNKNVDNLLEGIQFCSKSCQQSNIDCKGKNHTVTIKEFSQITYMHNGQGKKKVALVEKPVMLNSIADEFKKKLNISSTSIQCYTYTAADRKINE